MDAPRTRCGRALETQGKHDRRTKTLRSLQIFLPNKYAMMAAESHLGVYFVDSDSDSDMGDGGDDAAGGEGVWHEWLGAECALECRERALYTADALFYDRLADVYAARDELDRRRMVAVDATSFFMPPARVMAVFTGAMELTFHGDMRTVGSSWMCDSILPSLADVHACVYTVDGSVFMRRLNGVVRIRRRVRGRAILVWIEKAEVVADGDVIDFVVGVEAAGHAARTAHVSVTARLANPSCVQGVLRMPAIEYSRSLQICNGTTDNGQFKTGLKAKTKAKKKAKTNKTTENRERQAGRERPAATAASAASALTPVAQGVAKGQCEAAPRRFLGGGGCDWAVSSVYRAQRVGRTNNLFGQNPTPSGKSPNEMFTNDPRTNDPGPKKRRAARRIVSEPLTIQRPVSKIVRLHR